MKVIELSYPINELVDAPQSIVLALGFFDGLHKGHQRVIQSAKKIAEQRGIPLGLMSFNRHPAIIFKKVPEEQMRYLSPNHRKEQLLDRLGVDIFYRVDFNEEFAHLNPQAFVDQYLVGLNVEVVVAGFDYTYGPHEIANMNFLPNYAKNRFDIVSIPEERLLNGKISSTRIRHFLKTGDIEKANEMLGYYYSLAGQVVHGKKRGSTLIGYPTANLELDEPYEIPTIGVYAVMIQIDDKWYQGFASIGYNETFEDDELFPLTIEAHAFDFEGDLYNQTIQVAWMNYLRPMKKFETIEALIKQLKVDEIESRRLLTQVNYEQLI